MKKSKSSHFLELVAFWLLISHKRWTWKIFKFSQMKLKVYFITCAKSGDESLSGYNLTKPIKLSFLSQIQFFYLDSQTCKLKKWLIIKILELVAFWFQISEASGTRIFLGFRKGKIKSIESHCAKYEENLSPLTRSARRSGKADSLI